MLFTALRMTDWRVRWVRDIGADPIRGHVYWTTGGELWRANLDGSSRTVVVRSPEAPYDDEDHNGAGPDQFVVDAVGGKLYWTTDDSRGEIRRANLDGSQQEILFAADGFLGEIMIVRPD